MTKLVKAVLFDLDGTIVDTNELIIQSFLHALQGTVSDDFGREHIIPSMGLTLTDQLKLFSGLEDVTELTRAYREYNYLKHDEMVALFPGVAEVLPILRRHGIRLGVVTTKMRPTTERALKLFGLFEHLGTIVTLDDVQHPKPHPEPVQKAMEALGAEPEHTIMVGDSTVDIESAANAGALPVGVAWSLKGEAVLREAGAAHILHKMEDLLTLCGIEGTDA
ncbi:pyrophosphatase PpaX [Cohnella pontilimi]|uniref:Pyrophosphatase PpaX n=1 Tax=Cohnella pontilimi TaxID=2564100 RepID=A0A4U0F5L4_9BACL|nr:pyrophosphatase PpaX [Cohnella pontilimi]TJY39538.1 pyrophosphatase PpaX [Cohnella pontilimi]